MPSISYRNNSSGTLVAVWPGSTIQTDQGPRKQGQKYLGKVIDKDRLIFWKRDEGYFHFNPDDQSITALEAKDVPNAEQNPDGARKERHVLVDVGASDVLKTLIESLGYSEVRPLSGSTPPVGHTSVRSRSPVSATMRAISISSSG